MGRNQMNNLENALSELLRDSDLLSCLGSVLDLASQKGNISYQEVNKIVNDRAEDILLLGNEQRLLLPVRTAKSAAWEDRLLLCKPGESYEVPNIIRYIVEEAHNTGCWNPADAISKLFKEIGEPDWEKIPILIERLGEESDGYRISAAKIRKICAELGLANRVDMLIAELKGSGIMSPKLGSFVEVNREGSPLYELNPSIYVKSTDSTHIQMPSAFS
jgi:hypothetical protein